ncbi:hypothetical protein ACEWY4_017009 [Coilia grayii]|uniref:Ig-like domain-containing protein n=1 Tax=Coilia grayii TaxID=363190 RepID=A0ABD1JLZ5_9TELE
MDFQIAFVALCFCALGLHASRADECTKALEGSSYTIALNSPKQEGDVLVWKHNDKNVVYHRRRGKTTGEGVVDDNGSLLLKNLTIAMSGTYRAEHYSNDGRLIKSVTEKLCVIPKAPVPTLVATCSSSLYCASGSSKGFTLSWFHNNVKLKENNNPLLSRQLRENDRYRCRLSNDLFTDDKEDSNEVIISCSVPVLSRAVRLVLAGAVILIVILTLALVIVSCKYCPQRNRKRGAESLVYSRLQCRPSGLRQVAPEEDPFIQTPQEHPSPHGLKDQSSMQTPEEDAFIQASQEHPSPAPSQPNGPAPSTTSSSSSSR